MVALKHADRFGWGICVRFRSEKVLFVGKMPQMMEKVSGLRNLLNRHYIFKVTKINVGGKETTSSI